MGQHQESSTMGQTDTLPDVAVCPAFAGSSPALICPVGNTTIRQSYKGLALAMLEHATLGDCTPRWMEPLGQARKPSPKPLDKDKRPFGNLSRMVHSPDGSGPNQPSLAMS